MSPPKLRILIVDDNPSDRLVVRSMVFKLKPLLIHEAENGSVAEAKLKTGIEIGQPYTLVILDWNMPQTNGLKLLQQMRAHAQLKSIKVIVITATAERAVVVKPIDEKLLHHKIKALFEPPKEPKAKN
jgi:two-component system chemotaxis response regulator CheY